MKQKSYRNVLLFKTKINMDKNCTFYNIMFDVRYNHFIHFLFTYPTVITAANDIKDIK